jgi:two-component sensor histidine kinase
MNPTGTGKMDESAQRFRSHIQIVISLLNLHAQYEESANIPDFIKKLRLRMELMAETFLLAIAASEQKARVGDTFATIEKIVARVYESRNGRQCEFAIGDIAIDQPALATMGQIFAELLSNIYSRTPPEDALNRIVVRISLDTAGRIVLSVRDANFTPGDDVEPLDLLTSRIILELTRSLGGEARFNGQNIYDARLILPKRAAGV